MPMVEEKMKKASHYWEKEQCALSGFIIGQLILSIYDTEPNISSVIGIGVSYAF